MKARVLEIVQYERNPATGQDLHFNEATIQSGLAHKSIKRWAYIRHDKDTYDAADEERNPKHKAGTLKPPHWHVVLQSDRAQDIEDISKWFQVPANYIQAAKGRNAFMDKVEYLTHESEKEQAAGKYRYDDSLVKANFDRRKELDQIAEQKIKYGRGGLKEKDIVRHRVLYEGLTIRQLCRENPLAYQNDYATLDKFRYKYISDNCPMPTTRMNYYVCGRGGVGKGLICRALARSLYPDIQDDEDIFFEVGAKGVPFEGYDGQPVIIWNDRRAIDLLYELGGRGNVFNIFDTHPTRQKQNVKYSSVTLCNEVNIVNSVQPYDEFLDGLAGEYIEKNGTQHDAEDKGQSYRRFPFIIPLHEEDFDLLMNKGFYNGTREYEQYIEYKNIRGNMERIATVCGANEELARRLEQQTVKFIADKHCEVLERIQKSKLDEEAVSRMLQEYGTMAPPVEQSSETKEDTDDWFPPFEDGFDLDDIMTRYYGWWKPSQEEDNQYEDIKDPTTVGYMYHQIFGRPHKMRLEEVADRTQLEYILELRKNFEDGLKKKCD